jgi:hypothetical protein
VATIFATFVIVGPEQGMRLGLAAAAALALLVFGVLPARAAPASFKLSAAYDGDLLIKVLDIHVDEAAGAGEYTASASLRAYGILAAFKKFDIKASAHGPLERGEAHPGLFLYDNQDGERLRKVRVTWRPGEVTAVSTPPYGNLGDPPASLAQKLASADPLTQIMRITLAQSPDHVCSGDPGFFDGKQLYGVRFDPGESVGLTKAQQALGMTSAMRCTVHYHEIAGFKAVSAKKKNKTQGLRSAVAVTFGQAGPDGPWVILKVTAQTILGPAVIELKQLQISRGTTLASQ